MGTAVRLASGDFAGVINQDVYEKHVYGSKHKLRGLNAWAFDADSIDKFIRPAGVVLIRVVDREVGKVYEVGMGTFLKHRGEVDYGRGRQYFLILEHWRVK